MKNFIQKNYKTTLSGLVIMVLVIVYLLNKITNEQFLTTTAFLTGIGLIISKDGDQTGVVK